MIKKLTQSEKSLSQTAKLCVRRLKVCGLHSPADFPTHLGQPYKECISAALITTTASAGQCCSPVGHVENAGGSVPRLSCHLHDAVAGAQCRPRFAGHPAPVEWVVWGVGAGGGRSQATAGQGGEVGVGGRCGYGGWGGPSVGGFGRVHGFVLTAGNHLLDLLAAEAAAHLDFFCTVHTTTCTHTQPQAHNHTHTHMQTHTHTDMYRYTHTHTHHQLTKDLN